MRDVNRLDDTYDFIRLYHKRYFPDWRTGQFLINFNRWYIDNHGADFFYAEEDDLLLALSNFVKGTILNHA